MRSKGAAVSREKIENNAWNYDYEGGSNVVDVYISYLRRKIDDGFEQKLIHTVRGAGWDDKGAGIAWRSASPSRRASPRGSRR